MTMMKSSLFSTLFLVCIAFGILSCKESKEVSHPAQETQTSTVQETITILSPAEFNKQISAVGDIQLLDVRTAEEVAQGSIAGAVNIDVLQDGFTEKINPLNKELPIYVYCKKGGRSNRAAQILKEAGFKEIYDLQGGITNWTSSGFEVVR